MAIFTGGDALSQLWAFIVFPLIGGVVGALAWMAVSGDGEIPGTSDDDPMASVRQAAARARQSVQEAVDE